MKFKLNLYTGSMLALLLAGCIDVSYNWDHLESGTDEHTGDESNVTVDTLSAIDVSMYDQARIFPGLVDTLTERRTDTTLVIDLSRRYIPARVVQISQVPPMIYSTGLYAGAGEKITFRIESEAARGLTVQIGSHMDALTGSFTREPVVYTRKALAPGETILRNPLGGYIWIWGNPETLHTGELQITVEGAYPAPDFIVEGKGRDTDPQEWAAKIRKTTVPWLELRGKHIAFSVPREKMDTKLQEKGDRFATEMKEVIQAWDDYFETYFYEYIGLEPGAAADEKRAPDFPNRLVMDIELENKVYMRWDTQPIVAMNTNYIANELSDYDYVYKGEIPALFSAFGSLYTPYRNPWWGIFTDAASVIPLYRLNERRFREENIPMNEIFMEEGEGINRIFPQAVAWVSGDSVKSLTYDKFAGTDLSVQRSATSLLMLAQLGNYQNAGWNFYPWLYAHIKNAQNWFYSNPESYFMESLGEYYGGVNFIPFFEEWGYELSESTRAEIGDKFDRLPEKKIWQFDPLDSHTSFENLPDFDPTTYRYRHVRKDWSIIAVDANYNENNTLVARNRDPENILDGSKATVWNSVWENNAKPALPHYFIIDMKEPIAMDGFFMATGKRPDGDDRPPRRIILETIDLTTDRDLWDLTDENVNWYKIAEVRPFYEISQGLYSPEDGVKPNEGYRLAQYPNGNREAYRKEQFFDLLTTHTCRYLRVSLPEPNAWFTNWNENGLLPEEEWPDRGNDPLEEHTVAEFGTYYYKK